MNSRKSVRIDSCLYIEHEEKCRREKIHINKRKRNYLFRSCRLLSISSTIKRHSLTTNTTRASANIDFALFYDIIDEHIQSVNIGSSSPIYSTIYFVIHSLIRFSIRFFDLEKRDLSKERKEEVHIESSNDQSRVNVNKFSLLVGISSID